MRMDVKHEDAIRTQPFLDGEPLDRCFAFDTDEGWADVYETDGEGRTFIRDGSIARKRVWGTVTYEIREV